ncbi:hypothetical protein FQZ97_801630 [compost metagenome]
MRRDLEAPAQGFVCEAVDRDGHQDVLLQPQQHRSVAGHQATHGGQQRLEMPVFGGGVCGHGNNVWSIGHQLNVVIVTTYEKTLM